MMEYTRAPTSGLNTTAPPVLLDGRATPDCQNVLFYGGAVEKRGGFVPMFRDKLKAASIRTAGWRTKASVAASDRDFLIAPGCMVAGHRAVYSDPTALSFDFFFKVGDGSLISSHGGNSNTAGTGIGGPAPFTLRVRPILSKGPVKRTEDTASTLFGGAAIAWNTTIDSQWGPAGTDTGMPFCVYLFNTGTAWELRLACHVKIAGSWTLQVVTSVIAVEEGNTYHVAGAVAPTRAYLRAANIVRDQVPVYSTGETTYASGTVGFNSCPIQVFDCPQQFIEATTTGSATQRPGLGYNTAADGGYWNASKRFEGQIEDIAIWSGDLLAADATALDRLTKLSLEDLTVRPISYWNMLGDSFDYVLEQTGLGNHLYFVPRGPVSDKGSGGKHGSSWFFNGQTSYGSIDLKDDVNYRHQDTARTRDAAFLSAVRNNQPHGLAVEFWLDAIEPNFEQVVCEIQSVMRIAVDIDGKLKVYVRDGAAGVAAPASLLDIGAEYQLACTSTITLEPGRRYSVSVLRNNLGQDCDLYFSGVLDVAAVGLNANTTDGGGVGNSHPPSGITFGMGAYEMMIRGPAINDLTIANANQFNCDARSGFVGRIESFKILLTDDGPGLSPVYKPETEIDWRFPENGLFENPVSGARAALTPDDPFDGVRTAAAGSLVRISGHKSNSQLLRYLIPGASPGPPAFYLLYPAAGTLSHSGAEGPGFTGTDGNDQVNYYGVKLYHVMCYYQFDVDDRDNNYRGQYIRGESRYDHRTGGATIANQESHPTVFRHTQPSDCADKLETLGNLRRHCREGDVATEVSADLFPYQGIWVHRQRPYHQRSPIELGPQWAPGLVIPNPGENPVSLVREWEQQQGGRKFTIVGASHMLYWAKPIWEADSPFGESRKRSVALYGGYGSHIFCKASNAALSLTGTATKNTLSVSLWVRPDRLDGRRLIVAKADAPASTSVASWMLSTNGGALEVRGTQLSGAATWKFSEGELTGSTIKPSQTLRVNTWNHVYLTMQTAGVELWVNGNNVPLVDHNGLGGTAQTDGFTANASDSAGEAIYIGGTPDGLSRWLWTSLIAGGAQTQERFESWCGSLSEIVVRDVVDTTNFPTGEGGRTPRDRSEDDANTYLLLRFDEGEGWLMLNSATANPADRAHSNIYEFFPIADNLEDSSSARYDSIVFRDRLILSNGKSRPQQVRFTSLTSVKPLVVESLGMLPPAVVDDETEIVALTTVGSAVAAGTYQVWMAFVNADDKESEPVFLAQHVLAAPVATLHLRVQVLPRSPDPQVTIRRFWVTPSGGTSPNLHRDLDENEGADHTFEVVTTGSTGTSPIQGNKLVAPRGKHLGVAGSSLVIGDLSDEPAGQNAFAFSTPAEPSYFTLSSTAVIDSEDGKSLVGVKGNLGQVFLSKRDSVHQISVGAVVSAIDVEAALRLVFNSDGVGGGSIAANNLIYGAGDRGVFVFDNTNARVISNNIEPTYASFNRSDDGLFSQRGYLERQRQEYWLSVLRLTEGFLDRILVFSLRDGSWTVLTAPPHRSVGSILGLDEQAPIMALGTDSGQVLRYRQTLLIDYTDGEQMAAGAVTLQGDTGLSGTSTSLTVSGARFDTRFEGLSGAEVEIVYNGGTVTRRILRNTEDTLFWQEPLSGWTSFTSFVVGGYEGYWTTPWMLSNTPNREQNVKRIGVETVPIAGNLTVRLASLRQGEPTESAFPIATGRYEEFSVSTNDGWLIDMPRPREHHQGHYHRLYMGTSGINTPFSVVGYGLDVTPDVGVSHGGRRS